MTRVYRLDVILPEDSQYLGWQPEGWEEEFGGLEGHDGDGAPEYRYFSWPVKRLYLSASGARKRANLFRKWGASVTVVRSKPVEWMDS